MAGLWEACGADSSGAEQKGAQLFTGPWGPPCSIANWTERGGDGRRGLLTATFLPVDLPGKGRLGPWAGVAGGGGRAQTRPSPLPACAARDTEFPGTRAFGAKARSVLGTWGHRSPGLGCTAAGHSRSLPTQWPGWGNRGAWEWSDRPQGPKVTGAGTRSFLSLDTGGCSPPRAAGARLRASAPPQAHTHIHAHTCTHVCHIYLCLLPCLSLISTNYVKLENQGNELCSRRVILGARR